jgi:hypothetical protein
MLPTAAKGGAAVSGYERLKLLHDRLLADTDHRLDMHYWVLATKEQFKEKDFCGTACCALGFACMQPELQAEGLKFAEHEQELYQITAVEATPAYGPHVAYEAATDFFNISMSDAYAIFSPYRYRGTITKAMVCERIQEVLDKFKPLA